ncbi:ISLre2 family transposase [Streptococcus iniae]|uniref:ISLre2 family transposase n=1 Tax=Streptococcus iniae TaxID=1346 RepID=UPI00030138CA|nr:ISLre2 family transposase [Streptococcus iniae]ESR10515.1 hypothetical protein IUSA1_01180 [Streptococcus iniae IUSA1]KYJ81249.1 transposase [Streptococcus iniae]RMI73076.1 ISLre2 family transposase [Streptococcus iniae]HEK4517277.1 ISLre2 family transposase [Streptococcus iniae]
MITKFNENNFVEYMQKNTENEFLKRVSKYEKYIEPQLRARGFKRINESQRTVLFTFGEITYSRSRWTKNKETIYPVDEWLGLSKYDRCSKEFLYELAKYATLMPYRQVCNLVESAHNITITKDCVLKAVKYTHKLIEENEKYRFYINEENPNKIHAKKIYVEGDGVMVKSTFSAENRKHTDLTHFVIHTGSKKIAPNRYKLENKFEIVQLNYEKAKEQLLDYLYNNFEITDETVLITNSDNGKGYTKRVFNEIKKALGIKYHEHFWDAYHVNEKIKKFFKYYPRQLEDMAFKAIETHQKKLLLTVLDTVESLIEEMEEYEKFIAFKDKLLTNFKQTKPARLRGLPNKGIGVMETQHRKITYRMKNRGMYWSLWGVASMAKMIIFEKSNKLFDLFFGSWRENYEEYKECSFSAGRINTKIKTQNIFSKIQFKNGKSWSGSGVKLKY